LCAAALETGVTPLLTPPATIRATVRGGDRRVAGERSMGGGGFLAFLDVLEVGCFE